MRIMDIKEFKANQYAEYSKRRVSQFTKFLDKEVDFVTYYSINKIKSTTTINEMSADSYIGTDSPVRYNKINDLPIYGFPEITLNTEYNEENAGFDMSNFEGDIVLLQEIIEPCEGDCFMFDIFSKRYFFRVTEVSEPAYNNKPYYFCHITIGIPEYLEQLNSQVVEEYNAIFDNIGTEDKVVLSNVEFDNLAKLMDLYRKLHDAYIDVFYNDRVSLFEMDTNIQNRVEVSKYTDSFLTKFMTDNRIIVMDKVLKTSMMLDFNNIKADSKKYRKSIFSVISERRMKYFEPSTLVSTKELVSPFSLIRAQTMTEYYTNDEYCNSSENIFTFAFDTNGLSDAYNNISDNVSKINNLIVKYLKDEVLTVSMFDNIISEDITDVDFYMYTPIVLFIMRYAMDGITKESSKVTL